jgi:hypothetical protein
MSKIAWAVYSVRLVPVVFARAFAASGDVLAPLGLRVTSIPGWRSRWSGGGGDLTGRLVISGRGSAGFVAPDPYDVAAATC